MNSNQLMNMIGRLFLRKAVSKGIDMGFRAASNIAQPKPDQQQPQRRNQQPQYIEPGYDGEPEPQPEPQKRKLTPEERQRKMEVRQARQAKRAARQARQSVKATGRVGKM